METRSTDPTDMARPVLVRALVFALAVVGAAPASAQPSPAKHAQAEDQFRQGREAQNKGDYRRALDLLEASQAIEPGRGKLVNIAICEVELKLLAHALRHLEEVLPQLKAGDERLPIVQKRLADLRARVPMLRIDVPGSPEAHVKIDDEPVPAAALAGEIPVDPGKHTVTVDGRSELRQDVDLKEGERRTLHLSAVAKPSAAGLEAPAPDEATPSSNRRLTGFVLGGGGIAGLVVGFGTGLASIADHGSATSGCPTHVGCSVAVLGQASEGKALAIASTVAFVTGAAMAGAGVYLVVTSKGGLPKAATGLVVLPGGARFDWRF